ncbi:MAG: hypothetical protein MUE85_11420 [Microscillaceae bacterium]|jgi:hypothetical protein|nr:hypothetical protein [Microscillaceae bacterium]
MAEEVLPINLAALENYAQAFTRKLSDYFFIDHPFIEGKDILNFCDIKQINLLIIKHLFEKWQAENNRLESPYFDYQNVQVQTALKSFMNILSQHIQITKHHFTPLFYQATRDALILILNPKLFYQAEIHQLRVEGVSANHFKQIAKYIQFNKEILRNLIARLERDDTFSDLDALRILDEVYHENRHYIEPMDWRIKTFSDILPLDLDTIINNPDLASRPTLDESKPTPSSTAEATTAKVIEDDHDDLADLPDSLHARLKEEHALKGSILDSFQQSKIEKLQNFISINQKFQFINQLFKGDSLAFNNALDRLDNCQTLGEALALVKQDYAVKYGWNWESEESDNFLDLVERRFL